MKKIISLFSLGVILLTGIIALPQLSLAAQVNPFESITRTPVDAPTDATLPAESITPTALPVDSTITPTATPQTVTASPAATPAPTVTPGEVPFTGKEKDVIAETRAGDYNAKRFEKLSDFANRFNDKLFGGGNNEMEVGEKGARNLIITIARDAKNFFTLLALVFIILRILIFFFGSKGEEDAKVVRNAVIYTSLGIMLMQVSYVFITVLYNKDVGHNGASTGVEFYQAIIVPIINLIRVLASFIFLGMAFYAFFGIVTSGGDPKGREKGISTIIGAIIGFVLIKLAENLVGSVYGRISTHYNCDSGQVFGAGCQEKLFTDPNLSETLKIVTTIINYVNGFIGIVTLLIIIYAGWNIMFNGEEGMKKGKGMIKWIVVGMLLLVSSYILFRFFVLKDM